MITSKFRIIRFLVLLTLTWVFAAPSAADTRKALELERVLVTGNARLPDSLILGTLSLSARDTVNADLLADARLRLLRDHKVLRTVELATRPGTQRGLVILDVTVTERNAVNFETGYGQHDVYGWFLTLLGMRVEPAGTSGTDFRLGLRLGFRLAGADARLEQRGISRGFGLGGSLHVYAQEHLFYGGGVDTAGGSQGSSVQRYSQDIGRAGTELYVLREMQRRSRFSFGLRVEGVRPESTFVASETGQEYSFAQIPASMQPNVKHTLITGFFIRYARDTRDLFIYPRSGLFTLLELQANGTFLGGDESFNKARFDVRKHFDLGHWRVFSTRLAAGVTSTGAPYHERFFIGGIYTVRGFPELSLSPPSGDDGFAIASGELRVPLIASAQAPPRLAGLVFLDAGMGWRWEDPSEAARVDVAVGYGLRLRLPWVGTLGIDTGIPITDGRTDDRFYVHGILGFSF